MNSDYYHISRRADEAVRLLFNVRAYAFVNDSARYVADERANDIAAMVEHLIDGLKAVIRQQQQAAGL